MRDDMQSLYPSNDEIAHLLFRVAALLEVTQDNMYRVRAYRRAAFGVLNLPKPVAEFTVAGERPPLPGVGDRIHSRLHDLVNTGHMGVYEALLEEIGQPVASLLGMRGVGPKTAVRLVEELRVTGLRDVADAAEQHRIRRMRGFGPKREVHLLRQARSLLDGAA